jgi:hypothetical protein
LRDRPVSMGDSEAADHANGRLRKLRTVAHNVEITLIDSHTAPCLPIQTKRILRVFLAYATNGMMERKR